MKKKEILEAITKMWTRMSEGATLDEVSAELGVDAEAIQALYSKMLDHQAEQIRSRSVEHTYVLYLLNQTANIRDLTAVIDNFMNDSKQINAVVGAARARSDIYDKLMARGQECGLIPKQPEQSTLIMGVAIDRLSNKELQGMVIDAAKSVGSLVEHGNQNFLELPPPAHIHQGPSVELEPEVEVKADSEPIPEVKKKKKKKKLKKTGDAFKRKKKRKKQDD